MANYNRRTGKPKPFASLVSLATSDKEPEPHELRAPEQRSTADESVRQVLATSHTDLLRFLTRRLGIREEAEEVLSLFYVRSLSRAANVRNPRALRGWLRRVLETTIADHYRKQAALRRTAAKLHEVHVPDTWEYETIDQAICHCFYQLLPTLKPQYAEVIRRVDLEGESRRRVAASLQITENNLTVRLYRGRAALRRQLLQTCLTCPQHGFLQCDCANARRAVKATGDRRK
jgi:RNA polymerase sigma factor (sigma-70 family)